MLLMLMKIMMLMTPMMRGTDMYYTIVVHGVRLCKHIIDDDDDDDATTDDDAADGDDDDDDDTDM